MASTGMHSEQQCEIPERAFRVAASRSVLLKLIVMVVVALFLEAIFFYFYINYDLSSFSEKQAQQTKEFIYQEKQYNLRDLVDMAYSTVQAYYDESQDIEQLIEQMQRENS